MSDHIISIRSIALAVPLLACGAGIAVPANTARADECVTAPKSVTPKGSHWYYHTDRAKGRKCWFLLPLQQPAQHTTARPASSASSATDPAPAKKTATAGAPISLSAAGNAPHSRPRKAEPAATGSVTEQEPAQKPGENETAKPSTPAEPGAPASAPAETIAPAAAAAPAIIWPDPPAVAPVAVQERRSAASEVPTSSTPPVTDARASHDSAVAARDAAPTAHASMIAPSPEGTLAEILLIVALGLGVAGLFYRLVTKAAVRHGRRIIVDRAAPDWIGDRQAQAMRGDRQPHGFGSIREAFINDSQLSLVPAAGEYIPRRARPDAGRRPNNAPPEDGTAQMASAAPVAGGVSERQNALAQLIRDLDQLLQTKKQA